MELALLFLFLFQGLFIFCTLTIVFKKQQFIARVYKYFEHHEEKRNKKAKQQSLRQILGVAGNKISSIIFLKGYQKHLQKELERANIFLRVEEIITICFLLSLISSLYYSISGNLGLSFIIVILIWIFPPLMISSKKKKRLMNTNNQLANLLTVLSNSLKAGYSFLQAIEIAVKEMPAPMSYELAKMLREMNLGVPTEQALNNLGERVQSKDLEMVITAILIQRQVGGNLAEVLDNISLTIRERIKLKGEIKTATAQGRMSGMIISLLPVFLTMIFFFINSSYILKLFTTPVGIGMLLTGMFLQIVGIIFIKKIITIEM